MDILTKKLSKSTSLRLPLILWRSFRDMPLDNGFQWAAAIAYYSILSSIPLVLAVISLAANFVSPRWITFQAHNFVRDILPENTQVQNLITSTISVRRSVSILTFAALLVSASRVFSVLRRALNIAYCTYEQHHFFKRTLIEIIMAATIGMLLLFAFFSRFFFKYMINSFGISGTEDHLLFRFIMEILSAVALIIFFFIVYSRVPRIRLQAKSTLAGATTTTCLLLLIRPLFMKYVRNFTHYDDVYGSLTLIVIILFWAWVVAVIVLYGGEVASHYQAMAIEGKSAEEVKAAHKERSPTHTFSP
ncbi:MAG: YihY/virulence factor BrkB family protein [Bacteroidota bacterium]